MRIWHVTGVFIREVVWNGFEETPGLVFTPLCPSLCSYFTILFVYFCTTQIKYICIM